MGKSSFLVLKQLRYIVDTIQIQIMVVALFRFIKQPHMYLKALTRLPQFSTLKKVAIFIVE